jgi:hypothetical protein
MHEIKMRSYIRLLITHIQSGRLSPTPAVHSADGLLAPDAARAELVELFEPEYSDYINNKLAGDFAGALFDLLNTRHQGAGWMPIETAPKTGIIWLANYYSMRLGFWRKGKQFECHGSIGGGWADKALAEALGPCDLRFTPTKWQPTPTLHPTTPDEVGK